MLSGTAGMCRVELEFIGKGHRTEKDDYHVLLLKRSYDDTCKQTVRKKFVIHTQTAKLS